MRIVITVGMEKVLVTIATFDGDNNDTYDDNNEDVDDDNEDVDDDTDDNNDGNNDTDDNTTMMTVITTLGSSPDRSMARLPPIPSHLCCSLSKTGETTLF